LPPSSESAVARGHLPPSSESAVARGHLPPSSESAVARGRPRHIAWSIREYGSVDSTQNVARQILQEGATSGTVVVAREQTAGRGRLGRAWRSERDAGLYMSVILRPARPIHEMLSLGVGVAVMQTLRRQYGLDALIKWPNDIFIHGRKVCGILIEGIKRECFIVGIGINTCGPRISYENYESTSLALEMSALPLAANQPGASAQSGTRADIDHALLLARILDSLDIVYGALCCGRTRAILNRVRRHLFGMGREVFFEAKENTCRRGVLIGINDEGHALVACGDSADRQIVVVMAGDVSPSTNSQSAGEVRVADRD